MTETPVEIKVIQEQKKKGFLDKVKGALHKEEPLNTVRDSERFTKAGFFNFPSRQQLDYRLKELTTILTEIETDLEKIDPSNTEAQQKAAFKNIRKLFKAFMLLGAPWFRGLNNRELSKKAVVFFKLESMIGHLPSFYGDLKRCTQTLLTLSWQAIDVTPDPTVLFESKVVQQQGYGGLDLGGSSGSGEGQQGRREEL